MSIIEQYQTELQKDMHIDELNLSQAAYILPAIKHKWVARLINAKLKINKLEKFKKELKDKMIQEFKENNPKMSLIAIDRTIDTSVDYKQKIVAAEEEIETQKIVVLYLEKIENIFKNMTYDIKNIIDINKLETT